MSHKGIPGFLLSNRYNGMQQGLLTAPVMIVMMFAVIMTGGNKPMYTQPLPNPIQICGWWLVLATVYWLWL